MRPFLYYVALNKRVSMYLKPHCMSNNEIIPSQGLNEFQALFIFKYQQNKEVL